MSGRKSSGRFWSLLCVLCLTVQARSQGEPVSIEDVFLEDAIAVETGATNSRHCLIDQLTELAFFFTGSGWATGVALEGRVEHASRGWQEQTLIVAYEGGSGLDIVTTAGRERLFEAEGEIIGIARLGDHLAVALAGPQPVLILLDESGEIVESIVETVEPGSLRSFFSTENMVYRSGSKMVTIGYSGLATRRESVDLAGAIVGDPVAMDRGGNKVLLSSGFMLLINHGGSLGQEPPVVLETAVPLPSDGGHVTPTHFQTVFFQTDGNTRVERWPQLPAEARLPSHVSVIRGRVIGMWGVQNDMKIVTIVDGQPRVFNVFSLGGAQAEFSVPSVELEALHPEITVGADEEIRLDFAEVFSRADLQALPFLVVEYSDDAPAMVRHIDIDLEDQELRLQLDPFVSGSEFVTASVGSRASRIHISRLSAVPPSIELDGNGNIVLTWALEAGIEYDVQRSTDLKVFTSIGISTAAMFTDTAPPAGSAFYRIVARFP